MEFWIFRKRGTNKVLIGIYSITFNDSVYFDIIISITVIKKLRKEIQLKKLVIVC